MSTYYASRRVNGPDHPFDRRLVGYCRGLVPRVLQAVSYGPKNLDTTQLPPAVNGLETKYPIPDMAPPLLTEEERAQI
jgi:hypothetical protein